MRVSDLLSPTPPDRWTVPELEVPRSNACGLFIPRYVLNLGVYSRVLQRLRDSVGLFLFTRAEIPELGSAWPFLHPLNTGQDVICAQLRLNALGVVDGLRSLCFLANMDIDA